MAHRRRGCVLTCSALKQKYRDVLSAGLPAGVVQFVVLEASRETLEARVSRRQGHFMSPGLLDSQFATFEDPKDALHVSVEGAPEDAVRDILAGLEIKSR